MRLRISSRRLPSHFLALVFLAVTSPLLAQNELPVLRDLVITGNRSVTTDRLRPLLSTRATSTFSWLPWVGTQRLDPRKVRADLLRLRAFYRDNGFFEAEVDTVLDRSQADRVGISYIVREGQATEVRNIEITGLGLPHHLQESLIVKPGRRLSRPDLEADQLLLLDAARDSGYAFATVAVQSHVDQALHRATVTYRVEPGHRYRFASARVEGNEGVSSDAIRRGLTFRPSQLFSSRKLRQSRRQLYLSGAFRSVVLNVPDSLVNNDEVAVVVKVSERSPRTIRVGAGYDTESKFQGRLAWTHRSAFGGGQQLTVSANGSAIENEAFLSLRQPYVFGSRNWLSFRAFVTREERQEFRQIELGGNLLFERNIQTRTTFFFETSAGLIDFKSDSAFTEIAFGFRNDRRDDFLDPSDGLLVNLTVKERDSCSGPIVSFSNCRAKAGFTGACRSEWFLPRRCLAARCSTSATRARFRTSSVILGAG